MPGACVYGYVDSIFNAAFSGKKPREEEREKRRERENITASFSPAARVHLVSYTYVADDDPERWRVYDRQKIIIIADVKRFTPPTGSPSYNNNIIMRRDRPIKLELSYVDAARGGSYHRNCWQTCVRHHKIPTRTRNTNDLPSSQLRSTYVLDSDRVAYEVFLHAATRVIDVIDDKSTLIVIISSNDIDVYFLFRLKT